MAEVAAELQKVIEEVAVTIAAKEVERFTGLLLDELERPGTIRADGNIPGSALHDIVIEARSRYAKGETR